MQKIIIIMEGFTDDLFKVFDEAPKPTLSLPQKRQAPEELSDSEGEVQETYKVTREVIENCIHECASPLAHKPLQLSQAEPAKTYTFQLDAFQRVAVNCLEFNESVLVAAHTSAGKTVVAEYAIAMALKNNQRVIYTSPIKALSNQKYREFADEFKDVGLMTGDVTINETASCLVMTTEILRSMLYRGSEVIREMAWVIFDEIHYMRDRERGVVWEESIILLPEPIRLVFLSATIPNAREFAEWICTIKHQPCHVVYTEMRPTPLQHYIFPSGGDGLYLVVDEKGQFNDKNFRKAITCLTEEQEAMKSGKKRVGTGSNTDVVKIVEVIMQRDMSPAIIFSFSKRECEAYAISLNKFDYTSAEEKEAVEVIFQNAIDTLAEEDKELPMVVNSLPLLKKGIGIHHGGLLPIIKEVTELLFQEGYVKILFSTETFSMGLNMPARTVVFTNVRKFDGENFRWISGGEYIQMSGRAGRRGIDEKGICILMVDQKMEPDVAKGMVKGNMDPLNSTFHLSYNMLLNLMRIEDSNPEYMIKRSFHQFQNDRAAPEMSKKKKEIKQKLSETQIEDEDQLEEYKRLASLRSVYQKGMKEFLQKPEIIWKFLQKGRLIYVVDHKGVDWGWGIVKDTLRKRTDSKKNDLESETQLKHIIKVLVYASLEDKSVPCKSFEAKGEIIELSKSLDCICKVSSIRLCIPEDLYSRDAQKKVLEVLKLSMERLQNSPPLLDPSKELGISEPEFYECENKLKEIEQKEQELPVLHREDFAQLKESFEEKEKLQEALSALNKQIKAAKTMILRDDWKAMWRVLRRLEFCSENHIELKGRVACEISTGDELLATELMLSGVLKDLPVDVMVALLSCLVHQENSKESQPPTDNELAAAYQVLHNTARRFSEVFVQSKLNIDQETYVNSYKPSLMEAVRAWAKGSSFRELCEMTDVYEGSIIRSMRRLHELLRQFQDAAKAIQSHELASKFSEGIRLIERGIVFAASLYL